MSAALAQTAGGDPGLGRAGCAPWWGLWRTLRTVWRMTAMEVMRTMEYRAAFAIYMADSVVVPLLSLAVWLQVREYATRGLPFDRSQLVTYYLLLGLVNMLTASWLAAYLARNIRLGRISPWLLRPVAPLAFYLGNNLGEKVIKLLLMGPMVLVAALAFRADLRLPADAGTWLLFAWTLVLAGVVTYLVDVVVASLAFWIQEVRGIMSVVELAQRFLSGRLVPLAFFPASVLGLLEVQPFRYTLSFPLEVVTGTLSREALVRGLAWQVAWCVGLYLCYRVQWRYGLRAYSAVGA